MFLLAVRIVYIFIKCTSQIRHTCPYDTITDNVYKEINRKFNKLNTFDLCLVLVDSTIIGHIIEGDF